MFISDIFNHMTIPNNLRAHREKAALLQSDVARHLGFAGTDRISRWENGLSVPSLVNLFKLAVLYDVPPHALYEKVFAMVQEKMRQARQV